MHFTFLAVIIWASTFIFGKLSYEMLEPVMMVQLRLLIAALFSLPSFGAIYKTVPRHFQKRIWLLAFMNFPMVLLFQFIGLSLTSASSAITMLGAAPLLVVFIGHFFFNQRAKAHDWLLGVIAFLGIWLVVQGGESHGDVNWIGCLLVLAGSITFGFTLYLSKRIMNELSPKHYTNLIIPLGALLCLPFTALFVENWHIQWQWQGTLILIYLGVVCTWLAYGFWNKGLQKTSPMTTSIINSTEPVFGVLFAMIFLGETFSWLTALGMLLVISAASISAILPHLRFHLRKRQL